MKIYFVRHGESAEAQLNLHQRTEVPLSDRGRKQASFLAKRLKNIALDFIYASPFPRALETATVISEELEIPIEVMQNLSEHRRPTVQEGLPKDSDLTVKIKELSKQNRHNPDWKYEDGESVNEVWKRVGLSIDHLLKKHVNDTVLIVSHGNYMKTFLAYILSGPEINLETYYIFRKKFEVQNTGVTLIEHDSEKGWKLIFWNDVTHIESPDDMTA